jgi:hypothetical protein
LKYLPAFLVLSIGFSACEEKPKNNTPIVLGNPNDIILETDSAYLGNVITDISPTNKRSSEAQIATMMTQVDSLRSSKILEESAKKNLMISGLTVSFPEVEVVFDNLVANLVDKNVDPKRNNTVQYKSTVGELLEMLVQVNNFQDIKIEEQLKTQLCLESEGELIKLESLGSFKTPWFNLAGKDGRFISLGSNSLQFKAIKPSQIKSALQGELAKKNKTQAQINRWLELIENTKSHTDAPCKLQVTNAYYKISGTVNGTKVQKQIEIINY